MNFPCPTATPVPACGSGNDLYDSPFANLSSETPDHSIYVGIYWNPPGGDPPPLGGTWNSLGCAFVCESTVSQADADACAQQQAALCTWGTWYPPNDPGHISPVKTYGNALQQCAAGCPDGSRFTWTILPNTFFALSQALADQQAYALACAKAERFFFCMGALIGTAAVGTKTTLVIGITGANPGPFGVELISGSLPAGMALSQGPADILITGTPTVAGTSAFTLRLTDQNANFIQKSFAVTVGAGPCVTAVNAWTWTNNDASQLGGTASSSYSNGVVLCSTSVVAAGGFCFGTAEHIANLNPTVLESKCKVTLEVLSSSGGNSAAFTIQIANADTGFYYIQQTLTGRANLVNQSWTFDVPAGINLTGNVTLQQTDSDGGAGTPGAISVRVTFG